MASGVIGGSGAPPLDRDDLVIEGVSGCFLVGPIRGISQLFFPLVLGLNLAHNPELPWQPNVCQ